jgi:chromosome segregation ATPase
MSEETTQEQNGARPFEERVLAALADLQTRFTGFEDRLERLEAKQYDTKPIWETALAEILEVKERLGEAIGRLGRVEHKIDLLIKDIFEVRTDQLDIATRVEKLETRDSH